MSTNRSYRTTLLLAGALAAVVAAVFVFGDPMADPPRPPRPPDRVQATPDNVPRGEPAAEGPYAGVDVQLARVSEIAGAERLESAAAVRLGDRLRIGISTDRELHVYAFNREEGGKPTVMFPLAVLDARNPLPPGEHELPGTVKGAHQSYTVESKAPSEDVLVIVLSSPCPRCRPASIRSPGSMRAARRAPAPTSISTPWSPKPATRSPCIAGPCATRPPPRDRDARASTSRPRRPDHAA